MFSNPQPPPFPLEHEKLHAYREARALLFALHALGSLPGESDLRDQLRRASASTLLNIAEGASRQMPADKRRFYAIARGSLCEVGAALDLMLIRHRLSSARHAELRDQLVRVARLLGGLVRRE